MRDVNYIGKKTISSVIYMNISISIAGYKIFIKMVFSQAPEVNVAKKS